MEWQWMVPIAGQGPCVLLKGFRRLPDHLPAEGMNGAVPTSTLGLWRQALTAIQWHQMVQYPVHKSPPVPIPSQMNPGNAIKTYDFLSSVLLSRLRPGLSSAGLWSCHLSHTCYMLRLPYHSWFCHPNNTERSCDLTELHHRTQIFTPMSDKTIREISCSHGGEYEDNNSLLEYSAV
jgi:hypothetical protein